MDKFKLKSRRKRLPNEKQVPPAVKAPEAKVLKPAIGVSQVS